MSDVKEGNPLTKKEILLLEYVCDYSGNSDRMFIDYINEKNEIPQWVIIILLIRKAYELLGRRG